MTSKEQDFLKILGERIRGFRNGKGMTQARLADEAGLHTVSLSSIERGVANVSVLTLRAIAKALGITLSELLMIKEKGSADIGAPWEGEAEFAEVLMRYKGLGKKEKRILLNTMNSMLKDMAE